MELEDRVSLSESHDFLGGHKTLDDRSVTMLQSERELIFSDFVEIRKKWKRREKT